MRAVNTAGAVPFDPLAKVHRQIQAHVAGELEPFGTREELRVLAVIEGLLMELCAAINDGAQGANRARTQQAQNDASLVADFGLAIRSHRQSRRG